MKTARWLALLCAALVPAAALAASVVDTKHNLSTSGPGPVIAATGGEDRICVFCHAPHNAAPQGALWNRRTPSLNYTLYSSSTATAIRPTNNQPTGASLMCLSCHDGTIALGEVLSQSSRIAMAGGLSTQPAGVNLLGGGVQDLSGDHPISIQYSSQLNSNSEYVASSSLTGRVRLDRNSQLQCTTCHDPHDNTYGKFLVMDNTQSALCKVCHQPTSWSASSHSTSSATWNGGGTTPWPHTSATTVKDNACENCHRPHTAAGKQRVLNYAKDEDNCYSCHNGSVGNPVTGNILAMSSKTCLTAFVNTYWDTTDNNLTRRGLTLTQICRGHPVTAYNNLHDEAEAAQVISNVHIECVDCHNPHATHSTAVAGLPGALANVRGINAGGLEIKPVVAEYQVCFRCHADTTVPPGLPYTRTTRVTGDGNARHDFDTGNTSFHNVVGITGSPSTVPSLINGWTRASMLNCNDCHDNDTGPKNGAAGSDPVGPHFSRYPRLLAATYATKDRSYASGQVQLCAKCHNVAGIISSTSTWPFGGDNGHKKHVVDERAPCSVCHDPHGMKAVGTGTSATAHGRGMVNFDVGNNPAAPSPVAGLTAGTLPRIAVRATDVVGRGSCYLRCHGQTHNPENY